MTGLSFYKTHDKGVKINAGDDEYREHLDPDRWRFALQQMWSHRVNLRTDWRLKANINMLSDEYMLRDFYPEIYQRNSSPDNTVLLSRTDDTNDFSLLQRFVPNNFYIADQRTEFSYERIKSPVFRSPSCMKAAPASLSSSSTFLRSCGRKSGTCWTGWTPELLPMITGPEC